MRRLLLARDAPLRLFAVVVVLLYVLYHYGKEYSSLLASLTPSILIVAFHEGERNESSTTTTLSVGNMAAIERGNTSVVDAATLRQKNGDHIPGEKYINYTATSTTGNAKNNKGVDNGSSIQPAFGAYSISDADRWQSSKQVLEYLQQRGGFGNESWIDGNVRKLLPTPSEEDIEVYNLDAWSKLRYLPAWMENGNGTRGGQKL